MDRNPRHSDYTSAPYQLGYPTPLTGAFTSACGCVTSRAPQARRSEKTFQSREVAQVFSSLSGAVTSQNTRGPLSGDLRIETTALFVATFASAPAPRVTSHTIAKANESREFTNLSALAYDGAPMMRAHCKLLWLPIPSTRTGAEETYVYLHVAGN